MTDQRLRVVLMPYTGEPFQDRMLGFVCDLVRAHRARLCVLCVRLVSHSQPLPAPPTTEEAAQDPQVEHVLEVCRQAGVRNPAVEIRYARRFAPAVVQEATLRGADMLALAVPRPEAVDLALRQELDYLLAKTPCQLLVLRPGLGPV
jgi:hypothetical protein